MLCRICKEDKPETHFSKYRTKKTGNKVYQRKECSTCLNQLSRHRLQNKKKDQPVVLKSQTEVLIDQLDIPKEQSNSEEGRVCTDCYEWKPMTEFHMNRQHNRNYYYKNCKPCYSKKQNKGRNSRDPFGSTYRPNPNEYYNDYQKEKTFELMEAMGWVFDEPAGVWNKKNIKENGVFLNVIPDIKKERKRTYHGNTPVVYNNIMKNIEQVLKYLKEGHPYSELETIYDCSHTTIRKAVHDYKYEQAKRTN